jgi:hypothetical protein
MGAVSGVCYHVTRQRNYGYVSIMQPFSRRIGSMPVSPHVRGVEV